VVSVLLVLARPARAEPLTPEREALILTRALTYDGRLKARAGAQLVVGVIDSASRAGSGVSAGMTRAFRALSKVKVQGMPLDTETLVYSNAQALAAALQSRGIDVLYVCPGLEAELAAIIEVARQRQVLTVASRPGFVSRGLSLGVFPIDERPTILVNLPASRAEGVEFSSDLLRLAKVQR
jgi:hypothetical protein